MSLIEKLRKNELVLAGLAVFLTTFVMLHLRIRDSAPLTEGWWHVYVGWMRSGRLPYNDFELLVPPGYPVILRIVMGFVGDSFLALRVVGNLQIALIGLLLFSLFLKVSRPLVASVGSMASTTYLISGTAFISYDYVYTAILLFLLAVCTFLWPVNLERRKSSLFLPSTFLSGIFAVSSFFVKQTQGLAALVLIPTLIILSTLSVKQRIWKKQFLNYVVGVLFAASVFVMSLLIYGIDLRRAATQIFAMDSTKGAKSQILFKWLEDGLRGAGFLNAVRVIVPILAIALLLKNFPVKEVGKSWSRAITCLSQTMFVVIVISLLGSFLGIQRLLKLIEPLSSDIASLILDAQFFGFLVLTFLIAISNYRNTLWKTGWLPVCGTSLAMVWSCGMSAGITEIGAFIQLGIFVAWMFACVRPNSKMMWVPLLLISCFVVSLNSRVQDKPYGWWAYSVATKEQATATSKKGLTKGLRFDPIIYGNYQQIEDELRSVAECPGEIIQFPHMPLFLLDVGDLPAGRLAVYWYDFSSQQEVLNEIQRIKSASVKALVIVDLPPDVALWHERLFNSDKPLPHRLLLEELRLIAKTKMSSVQRLKIGPDLFVDVYVNKCKESWLDKNNYQF